jgi:electron transport complex protein RnfB
METNLLWQGAQAVAALGVLGSLLGALLGVAARRLSVPEDDRAEAVAALLPGSNCAQCGFVGCKQAASAMVEGRAAPTSCPPGGVTTAQRIAQTLGLQLDLADAQAAMPQVAWVDEARCIGCTRCIRKCTADAIVGAAKQMHTILPEACHACELCATECPTQAIAMKPVLPTLDTWHWPKPAPALAPAAR